MSITHNPLVLQRDDYSSFYTVETQGSLFQVKTPSRLKRAQQKSTVDDKFAWLEAMRLARRDLFLASLTPNEPFRYVIGKIALNPPQKLIELMAQKYGYKSINRKPTRGIVTDFSKKSRLRLIKQTARLKASASGLFLTFTYRENMQDAKRAKADLERVLLWLKRKRPKGAFMWRMEFQKRGAIHFHVVAFNVHFVDANELTAYWQGMTRDDSYPDVSPMHNRRQAMKYVSKYLAKLPESDDASADSGFISVPYSDNYTGRFWGVTNRKMLPLAPLDRMEVHALSYKSVDDLRRYARRYWSGVSRRPQGFTLFVKNGARWMELARFCLLQE